ncbi:hypothetical protein [Pelomonas cellulosilytica]|uniref:Major facilitator superfamily (MFS) profile domain-containing protein n=1 Tax=Pelomonas cellulosilytica TaxID=2906762 RepID=A0ABS8XZW8_9BURK|nr:hypothetical protein [Pelomonas sp. P8]MCE4558144.1 hypothetical protein [Pelomonas sp. P8]
MAAPVHKPIKERARGTLLDGIDVLGIAAFGGGAAVGVATAKFMLGGFLAVLALGVFVRLTRRRSSR